MSIEVEFEEWFNQAWVKTRHLSDEVLRTRLRELNLPAASWVGTDDSIMTAVEVMRQKRIGAVLVCCPRSGGLAGIFTERDLLMRCLDLGNLRAHEVHSVMTPHPVCLTCDDTVGFALNKMMTQGFRHLPILQQQGRPHLLVSVRALLTYLAEYFPEDVINLPPEPQRMYALHGG
jgi:CBS domain-containing protein